jgi:predicted outer membrane protein
VSYLWIAKPAKLCARDGLSFASLRIGGLVMKNVFRFRSVSISLIVAGTFAVGGWAMAQRGDTKSDDKSQPQGRGWAGQTDQGLLDQIAVDGLMQMNKSQIELANFALKHTQNQNVRKFAQASIENCTNLNNALEKFVDSKRGEQDSSRGREASNWKAQNLDVIRRDISNQVVAGIERELAQYEGGDFDRAFLGQQCWGHVTFVAVAKASGKHVSNDLRKLVAEAATEAEKQLDDCRKMIRDLSSPLARAQETTPRR